MLTNLSMRGTIYFRASFTRLWGVAVPSCGNVARFHFAHRGNCLIRVDGVDEPIGLAQGDLVIIPTEQLTFYTAAKIPKTRFCRSIRFRVMMQSPFTI
ncbi:cupin domain-containing protein [Ruegeria profundi]|nr:cupin domain-containing protein [Ruegeria profundi]